MIKALLVFGAAAMLLIPLLLGLIAALGYAAWRALKYETRFRKFFKKYSNDEIARMIASGKIWTGQTSEQLRDAKGAPLRIETLPDSEIWIYQGGALNPAGLQITLSGNRVDGWN